MKKEHLFWLKSNQACNEGMEWIEENNIQSLEEVWNTCERGDWLLWMAEMLCVDQRKLMMCGALCAHTVIQHMKDPRSRNAVRVIFLWSRGKATDEQLEYARYAARYAARDAAAVAADTAADAAREADIAADAARAADARIDVDWDDIDAVYVAWFVADTAAAIAAMTRTGTTWDAAEKENQRKTADITRKILTEEVMYILSNL
ncbi:MAG: hypothetical protein M0R31_07095 [Candidatus Riflebacteria bacterium]|nr:hypothetical protein [Candidatus Riflebacteria bacterium]